MPDDTNTPPEAEASAPRPGRSSDDADLRIQGPIRRNLWLIITVAVVLAVGPFLTRFLESYRAVVLDVQGEEMLLGYEELPPEWVDAVPVSPGSIIEKEHGSWDPHTAAAGAGDDELLALYERYASSWTGEVVEVIPPPTRAQFAVVVVEKQDGERLKLSTDKVMTLDGARVGQRVVKEPSTWDPVLAD